MNKRDIVESIRYAMYSCIPDHDDAEHLTSVIFHDLQKEVPHIIERALISQCVKPLSLITRCSSAVFHELFKEADSQ